MFQVPDFPDYYVDRFGVVWNLKGKYPTRCKQHTDKHGFKFVAMRNGNKTRSHRVHLLVLRAHIPEPWENSTVVHRNGDRTDNRLENLEWAPPRGQEGTAVRKLPVNKRGIKLTLDQVRIIREMASKGIPQRAISEKIGISQSNVSRVVTGESWKHVTS